MDEYSVDLSKSDQCRGTGSALGVEIENAQIADVVKEESGSVVVIRKAQIDVVESDIANVATEETIGGRQLK